MKIVYEKNIEHEIECPHCGNWEEQLVEKEVRQFRHFAYIKKVGIKKAEYLCMDCNKYFIMVWSK